MESRNNGSAKNSSNYDEWITTNSSIDNEGSSIVDETASKITEAESIIHAQSYNDSYPPQPQKRRVLHVGSKLLSSGTPFSFDKFDDTPLQPLHNYEYSFQVPQTVHAHQNTATHSSISVQPLERTIPYISYGLWCISKSIEEIRNKWSEKEIDELKNIDKILIFGKQISKPKPWMIDIIKWVNRCASATGGSLIFIGAGDNNNSYSKAGGIIAITSPFVEFALSNWQTKLEKNSEEQKKLFADLRELKENYDNLLLALDIISEDHLALADVDAFKQLKEIISRNNISNKVQKEELVEECKSNWKAYCKSISQPIEVGIKNLIEFMRSYECQCYQCSYQAQQEHFSFYPPFST